jgi:hypothetical protein
MNAEKREVLTDSCSAHGNITQHMEQVAVTFLLPNFMSILQPLDQGIVHAERTL